MSSAALTAIQTQINVYGYPILLIFGTIGNILIVILFKKYHQNACAIYILSAAIANGIYVTVIAFFQIFPFYYEDESTRAFILCKFRYYITNTIGQITRTMLILSCIDRYLITSNRPSFRTLSTPKRAVWAIIISIIIWPILASHIAIMNTIEKGKCNSYGVYTTVYSLYVIVFICTLPPIVLGIFGYLTYSHMRQLHLRIQPSTQDRTINTSVRIRRQDRDLLVIVLAEIVVYVITNLPYALIFVEILISQYAVPNKSALYSQIESFIRIVSTILLLINNSAPFYIFLVTSKSFRRDFQQLTINSYRMLTGKPPNQIVSTTDRTKTMTHRDIHF